MRSRWRFPALGPFVLLATTGCVTQPLSLAEADQRLGVAERHVAAAEWDEAQAMLETLAADLCPRRLRDRRDLALARAWSGSGDSWEAFRVLEPFADRYPHSDLRPIVVEMVWQIGDLLLKRDGGFLFFWSDAAAGRTVLEHLVTRHPDSPRMADALRLLGDQAYDDGNFQLAQQRYRDLMLHRPDSEWAGYAQFRFAMSAVAVLEGPDYDLDGMQIAVRELRDFLRSRPENPTIVRAAEDAIARVLGWQQERHMRVAAFYRRIGNGPGEMHHLELAAGDEFATTPGHAEAVVARDAARAKAAAGALAP